MGIWRATEGPPRVIRRTELIPEQNTGKEAPGSKKKSNLKQTGHHTELRPG